MAWCYCTIIDGKISVWGQHRQDGDNERGMSLSNSGIILHPSSQYIIMEVMRESREIMKCKREG